LKLFIKNIASFESLKFVRTELERHGVQGVSVEFNEINAEAGLTPAQYGTLRLILQKANIQVFEHNKDILVQRIKNLITDIVYHSEGPLIHNLSTYMVEKLRHDYTYMSNLFSANQDMTIEKFYICHKIERVKQLLLYEKMRLTDIAIRMHYSSLAHLSSQFKKVTGLTTSQFKQQHGKEDPSSDALGR
jgi:YesN/AraC family two-component response regulator